MTLQPVSILGTDGWVSTPKEKMDNLFMHFVEANHSQTTLSRGNAYSFQYYLAIHDQNPSALADALKLALSRYFSGYFNAVDLQVTVVTDPRNPNLRILQVFLEAQDEYGKTYNLAKVSSDIKSKTIRWANLNNNGDENIFTA